MGDGASSLRSNKCLHRTIVHIYGWCHGCFSPVWPSGVHGRNFLLSYCRYLRHIHTSLWWSVEPPVEQMLAPDDEAHGSPFSQRTHPPLVFVVWCFHHSLIDNNHSSSSIIHRLYRHDSTQTQQGAYQSFVNWFTTPNERQQQGGGWPSLFKICGSSTQQVTSLWFLSLTRYINRIRLLF